MFERLNKFSTKLADVVSGMFVGLQTSADTVYLFKESRPAKRGRTEVFSKELGEWVVVESALLKPVVRSGSIKRNRAEATAQVLFPYHVENCEATLIDAAEMSEDYPLAWDYLKRNKSLLAGREKGKFQDTSWYRFGRTQNLGMWEQTKLMIPYMTTELAAYLDHGDNYYFINVTTGGYGITSDGKHGSLAYLCGLLNSRLLDFYFKCVSSPFHGGYYAANKQFIEQLPIYPINFADGSDKSRHDQMVTLVEQMLGLHQRLSAAKTPHDKTLLERQLTATDAQIDRLVYDLYGLSAEEIGIVEGTP